MFGTADATPFDLRFSIFRIPVRVHPLFWLVSALLEPGLKDLRLILLWVFCVFLSILVHELGHALSARYFGWPPEIVLYSCGGCAQFIPTWGYTTRRAVLVLLAGPGAGFALYGLIQLFQWIDSYQRLIPPTLWGDYLRRALLFLSIINLWWGIMNLLPVYPLDGGQIARHLLVHYKPTQGWALSLKISVAVGGAVAIYFFSQRQVFNGMLFLMLAAQSYQELQSGGYYR